MRRSRLFVPLVSTFALVACAPDNPGPVAPVSAARAASGAGLSAQGRYIVLASASGFGRDFTTRVSALGGVVESLHAGAGVAVVTGLDGTGVAQLTRVSGVSDVEPDAVISLDTPVAAVEADASSVGDPSIASQTSPSLAARYSWQWNMRLIHADSAWAHGKLGNATVRVAILDTGIDYDAPDLNGLVDLPDSRSFVASDDAITTTYFPSRQMISDYNGHGTNVATQVSSKAVALAGVTSRTTLIGVKVLDANGRGTLSGVLNGVLWAADRGADVANMSLGGGFAKKSNGRYVGLINRTFNYANQKGMLVVVAAGNDSSDLDHDGNELVTYCAQQHVICVSAVGPATGADFATSSANAPAFYTNFGRSAISVAGPGGNATEIDPTHFAVSVWPWGNDIASWVWSYCSKTKLVFASNGTPSLTACAAGNRISGFIGTSQASPHVAGLAALLVAETGSGHPARIKAAIEGSAVDLGLPGADPFYGRGRVDVARALGL